MNFRRRIGIVFIVAVLMTAAYAADVKPTKPAEIAQAIERGKALRAQTALLPAAIQKTALIMKIGGVRCGQALVSIEDAKGENGATYKLVERFKTAMSENDQTAVIEYHGSILLGADLSALSGQLSSHSDLNSKTGERHQDVQMTTTFNVQNDELAWNKQEKTDDGAAIRTERSPIKLHGEKPIPKNALIALAAFAVKQAGFNLESAEAVCVPSLDMSWELEQFAVEPAWISFGLPAQKKDGAVLQMIVRSFVGEVADKGLAVDLPTPEVWQEAMRWTFDENLRPVEQPGPGDPSIEIESADPEKIDMDAALDLEQIAAAIKAQFEKAKPKKQ